MHCLPPPPCFKRPKDSACESQESYEKEVPVHRRDDDDLHGRCGTCRRLRSPAHSAGPGSGAASSSISGAGESRCTGKDRRGRLAAFQGNTIAEPRCVSETKPEKVAAGPWRFDWWLSALQQQHRLPEANAFMRESAPRARARPTRTST